ncbi:MAG: hypothetical protein ACFFAU_04310 [Candidatus Hodarchaeota archaeon]
MAMSKNQVLSPGTFYPTSDKKIVYRCQVRDTTGFLKDIGMFSVLIGFFAFFLIEWYAILVIIVSWLILATWLIPKHYKFIQFEKYTALFGYGSILELIRQHRIYKLRKIKFDDIYHIRLDRWERKKRGGQDDSFGRIEIKFDNSNQIFEILIEVFDLTKLVKIFETYRFQSKVQKKKLRGEFMIIFPNSPFF